GEVAGGFSSEAISEEDLAAGRFDGAQVELFLVNWQ
ncbi:baseplate hub protein, partial [Rhizobium sp. BR5]